MKKNPVLFIVLLFLIVQLFSALHLAEFGFQEHRHHGHVCSVYLLYGQSKFYTGNDTSLILPSPDLIPWFTDIDLQTLVLHRTYSPTAPRAPPGFPLS